MGFLTVLRSDENDLVGATITPSSADSSYPIANLTALPVAKAFRFTGDTSEDLQIDLGAAQQINFLALVNHNLTSNAVITLNGGSSSNPDGSQFQDTIPWREFDAFKILAALQTWRYWKIIIADAANPDGFIEIGYALLGDCVTFGFNFEWGWSVRDEFENLEQESEFGVGHYSELFNRSYIAMQFSGMDASDDSTLRKLYRGLKRNLTPIFVIPDRDEQEGYFARIVNQRETRHEPGKISALEFREESRGDKVTA